MLLLFSNFSANWVKVNGTKYQTPCGLIVGKTDQEEPIFGEVRRILVDVKAVYFEFQLLHAVLCPHYHCFILSHDPSRNSKCFIINQSCILDYHPYGIYYSQTVTGDSTSRIAVIRNIIM